LIAVKNIGYDVIAMAKKTSKVHYLYNGEMQPLTKIFRENRKYLDDRTLEQMFYLLVDDLNSAKY
jgi:hypothetical protein